MSTGPKPQTPESQIDGECCTPRTQGGWSPSRLPANTAAKRFVDRILPATGVPALLYFAAVIGLLLLAGSLPNRAGLVVDGIAAAAGGLWCGANFWRCRHAHCIVTSIGWSLLSLFAFFEAGIGYSLIGGDEQPVFLAILVAGLAFEACWTARSGTNAVVRNDNRT